MLTKAGRARAAKRTGTIDALADQKAEGGDEELAPIVAAGRSGVLQELTRQGLVDEYRITVHPVVFGEGDRLFAAPSASTSSARRFFAVAASPTPMSRSVPTETSAARPWALSWAQGADEHDHDPEPE